MTPEVAMEEPLDSIVPEEVATRADESLRVVVTWVLFSVAVAP